MLLYAVIFLPFAAAALAAVLPSDRLRPWLIPITALLHFALVLGITATAAPAVNPNSLLGLDALGRFILFVVSLLYAACSFYALGYFRYHADWENRIFITALLAFLGAMTIAAASRHLGLLWVAVEATTLVSAPMIYYNRNRFSIEATWKYLLLCSVGIALAMLGILFVAYAGLHGGGEQELLLDQMLASASLYSKPWLRPVSSFCWWASAPRWGWRRCTPGNRTPTARPRDWWAGCWPAGSPAWPFSPSSARCRS